MAQDEAKGILDYMKRFLWLFLPATLLISAMELPIPSSVRKYACCPEKFGYHFMRMDDGLEGRESIHLGDFEETKACGDDECVVIRSCLFKRLIVELYSMANEHAQESFLRLLDRMRKGEIAIGPEHTHLSHKDMCHGFFSHLQGYKDGTLGSKASLITLALRGWLILPFFLELDDKPSCIHRFKSIMYQYPAHQGDMLFGSALEQEFASLKPLPSLRALAAQAIAPKDKQNARKFMPEELKRLIF